MKKKIMNNWYQLTQWINIFILPGEDFEESFNKLKEYINMKIL